MQVTTQLFLFAITLFCTIKGIPIKGLVTCSYRKAGVQECQPDVSYYIGERIQAVPKSGSAVDLNHNPPPDLLSLTAELL